MLYTRTLLSPGALGVVDCPANVKTESNATFPPTKEESPFDKIPPAVINSPLEMVTKPFEAIFNRGDIAMQ